MIETIISTSGLTLNAIIIAFLVLIYQRLGRVEKDIEILSTRNDAYESKVDRMEGRMEGLRRMQ